MRLLSMIVAGALTMSFVGAADAAEIKVMSSNALKTVLEDLGPKFEKASGHKIVFDFNTAVALKAKIEKGEAFDAAILTAPQADDLVKQGKFDGATRTDLAKSDIGMAVKKGAPKPDIRTVDAFKRTLMQAKSIGFVEQGGSGIYLKGLFVKLGVADAIKDRLKPLPASNPAAHAVANGEAEIGMTQISEILPYAGAELVGPLPAEIQLTTVFAIATSAAAKPADAAKALIKFLKSPEAAAVFKAKALDPA
jgi:molybdate transport system substrate-binding protein